MSHALALTRAVLPRSAMLLSLAAILLALMTPMLVQTAGVGVAILWTLVLVPPFLMAYHRGHDRATTLIGVALAGLIGLLIALTAIDLPAAVVPAPVTGGAYVAMGLGVAWVAATVRRTRVELAELPLVDTQTGLASRAFLARALETQVAIARRGGPTLSLVLLELDGFHDLVERHGESMGDRVLRRFATMLEQTTRGTDVTARYGATACAAALSDADAGGAQAYVARVRHAWKEAARGLPACSVNVGIAPVDMRSGTALDMMQAAEQALAEARAAGSGTVRVLQRAA